MTTPILLMITVSGESISSIVHNFAREQVSKRFGLMGNGLVVEEKVADGSLSVLERNEGLEDGSNASVVYKAIPKDQGQHTGDRNNQESQGLTECSAVHLKNLPANYTIDSIENAFKEFGAIKSGGTEVWVTGDIGEFTRKKGDQNRHGSDQVKGTIVVDETWFQNWLKTMEERTSKVEKEERGTIVVDEVWFQNWLKTMEKRTSKLEEEERRIGDFWDWQRSMDKQSKFREEAGETGIDHSWDYNVVMEEQRKFMKEDSGGERRRKPKLDLD
ncbi:unnamed protein product [Arabis nemorensis]|uniref:RRM domain-containing protein n=1 Tax=Arabis nemorensis TaxID=586526 RepID=A0A565B5D3_9BRAS|nr:unnamed protein product [Arabis nemorensis]